MIRNALSLVAVLVMLAGANPVQAQDVNPPVDPNSAWSEVLNPDGSINYGNLTDVGVVTDTAAWMPSIPFVGDIPAEYHVYTTPSGNSVVLPNATTLFFMALNPSESGYLAADSSLTTNGWTVGADLPSGISSAAAVLSSLLNIPGGSDLMASIKDAGYNGPTAAQDFFSAVIAGEQSIWSLNPIGFTNFLFSLGEASISDANLYAALMLYTPSSCFAVPGGCPVDLAALFPPEIIPAPLARSCPAPVVSPGRIIRTGLKVAPNYPLVVGQDPEKTGVTVQLSAHVEPTTYTFWTLEPVEECTPKPWPQTGQDCEIVDWTCEQHTQTYPECVSLASGTLRLTQESKDWILNTLNIRYPGAFIHHPTFSFPASTGCRWSYLAHNVPVADPGDWDININGQTSGTPVSAARPFGGRVGDFEVWLKETAIIK